MTAAQIKQRIESIAQNTYVELIDLTGTQDHWQALIVSPIFEGKKMMEQHRLIYSLFDKEIQSNEVHALTLKTFTPEQYQTKNK